MTTVFSKFIEEIVEVRIKVQLDLQVDKCPVVVKGPFFP
jgi:hypothetical protein